MTSTNVMLKKVAALVDTRDVTDWENNFLKSLQRQSREGTRPDLLTERQLETLERIYDRHFAG